MPSLYELSRQLVALDAALCASDGELSPEVEAEIGRLDFAEREKVDGYCALIRSTDSYAKACKHEARTFSEKAARAERLIERLKSRVDDYMSIVGREVLDGDKWKLRRQTNGGAQAVKVLCSTNELPEGCVIWTSAPDKDKLRERLMAGEEIYGVALEPRGTHIRVT